MGSGDRKTRRELAAELDVVMQTISKWEQAGLPVLEPGRKGKPSIYSLSDVKAWIKDREVKAAANGTNTVNVERARKESAQADLIELNAAALAGRLIPVEDVERAWVEENTAIKTKLLSWPGMYADQMVRVVELEGAAGVERFWRQCVEAILTDLSHVDDELVEQQLEENPPSSRRSRKK